MLFEKSIYKEKNGPWMVPYRLWLSRKISKILGRNGGPAQTIVPAGVPRLVFTAGAHRCNACGLCPAICPAQCLHFKAEAGKVQSFKIDVAKCIQCSLCWEICPTDALAPVRLEDSEEGESTLDLLKLRRH